MPDLNVFFNKCPDLIAEMSDLSGLIGDAGLRMGLSSTGTAAFQIIDGKPVLNDEGGINFTFTADES